MRKVIYYPWPESQECLFPRCIHASLVSNPVIESKQNDKYDDGAICHLNYDKSAFINLVDLFDGCSKKINVKRR